MVVEPSFLSNNSLFYYIVWIFFIFLYFLIAHYWVNFFYFFEDNIIVFYPMRIFKRRKIIYYKNIEHIRYTNALTYYSSPRIIFVFKDKKFLFLPSKSFIVFSFNKRKQILQFFNKKGICVKILSQDEQDKDII